ncbi:MAG: ribbon-helix-helix protein, CopG family [Angustibacter sp.]
MAINLRLAPEAERAVREEARRSGRSQQELIRQAVDEFLGLRQRPSPRTEAEAMVAEGLVRPPRTPFKRATDRIRLPEGLTTADLLDREDRV